MERTVVFEEGEFIEISIPVIYGLTKLQRSNGLRFLNLHSQSVVTNYYDFI